MGVVCDMNLENNQYIYCPGDLVSGSINLTLDERTLLKALAINIAGFAITNWEKHCKEKKNNENANEIEEFYKNREDYIATTHYFIGSDDAIEQVIEEGFYHYNFSFHIPENCPSTFEGSCGHIRYQMKVCIFYADSTQTCCFCNLNVMRPLDLKKLNGVHQAYEAEFKEQKSVLKFWQHPLQLQINIPKTGYMPGEKISVYIKVLNYDLLQLSDITYRLNLVTTFTGFLKKKANLHIERTSLATVVYPHFEKRSKIIQNLQNLEIPETPPSFGLTECRCIQISYEVEVIVSTTQKDRQISGAIPFTIGTISMENKLGTMPKDITASAPSLIASCVANDSHEYNAFRNACAPNLEPISIAALTSSFKEAEFMKPTKFNATNRDIKSIDESDEFKPKYLFYNILPTTNVA